MAALLKLSGIICILSGCTGIGLLFAWELDQRVAELSQLLQLTLLLQGEIRYLRRPLPEAFGRLEKSASGPFGEFFRCLHRDLEQRSGHSAEEIWRQNLKRLFPQLHINLSEQRDLEQLGSMLGYLDAEMQIQALNYYMERLKLSIREARELSQNRRRLYQYLGALSGAALAVLLF